MQHNRSTLATLANAADTAWTTIRVFIYYVAPIGFALIESVAILQRTGHPIRAYLLIVAAATIGIGVAWGGLHNLPRRPHRRHPVPASVRAINRRAARILIPSAVGLATVLAILATKPAGLWLLAYVATFGLIGLVAFEGAHFIVVTFRRGAR